MIRLQQDRTAEADAIYETLAARYSFEQLAALVPSEVRAEILKSYKGQLDDISAVLRYNPKLLQNIDRLAAIDRPTAKSNRGSQPIPRRK